MTETGSLLSGLQCDVCGGILPPSRPVGTCPGCGHALFAVYDLPRAQKQLSPELFRARAPTLWRYRELLPVQRLESIVTLGEGFTPILELGEVPEAPGLHVLLKDDGQMPTGSFKARGMAVAVSRAKELGVTELFVPSAGNAGTALAAYGARAGMPVRVYVPERTPEVFVRGCRMYGAQVDLVPGTIREAGDRARAAESTRGSFDMSTFREPYRVEGKKTMGFEIFEQLPGDRFPDVVVYPTGGGTGLVGMYRAFHQLQELGWIDRVPRLMAIQSEGCAPVVRALETEAARVEPWAEPETVAPGLNVPAPFASERILEAIRSTHGSGATVSDRSIVQAMRTLARRHGISAAPEGAAAFAGLATLVDRRQIRPGETVLLYNTGTGIPFDVEELAASLATSTGGGTPSASGGA